MALKKYNDNELYIEWKNGKYKSIAEMSRDKKIPYISLSKLIGRVESKLYNTKTAEAIALQKASTEIANRIVEAECRQANLGKRMQEKALANIDNVNIESASDITSLAAAGSTIERKALRIEDDKKDSKIVVQLAVGIKLGTESLGVIDIKPVSND